MDIGKTADGSLLKQRMANLHPLGCCSVIYTTDVCALVGILTVIK